MNALIYYSLLPLIYLISLLPFRLIYLISDFFYFIIYYVFAYRKNVVITNLKNSFPDKSEFEIKVISKKFYRYFCDLLLETIKIFTISEKELNTRVKFKNIEVFNKLYLDKKSAIVIMGHCGNWELIGAAFGTKCNHEHFVLYHPLSNKYFNHLIIQLRTRFGNKLYSMNDALRNMLKNQQKLTLTTFIADQTPSPKTAYWTDFLNQQTPFFNGAEKIAKKLSYPIVYVSVSRPKRGFYEISSELLAENQQQTNENYITELFVKKLEKDICKQPEIWLWSHRRWKHRKI